MLQLTVWGLRSFWQEPRGLKQGVEEYNLQEHFWGGLPIVGWALPHPLSIKEISYRPFWSGCFLNWGSFFPGDSSCVLLTEKGRKKDQCDYLHNYFKNQFWYTSLLNDQKRSFTKYEWVWETCVCERSESARCEGSGVSVKSLCAVPAVPAPFIMGSCFMLRWGLWGLSCCVVNFWMQVILDPRLCGSLHPGLVVLGTIKHRPIKPRGVRHWAASVSSSVLVPARTSLSDDCDVEL